MLLTRQIDLVPTVLRLDRGTGKEENEARAVEQSPLDGLRPLVSQVNPLVVPDAVAALLHSVDQRQNERRAIVGVACKDIFFVSFVNGHTFLLPHGTVIRCDPS